MGIKESISKLMNNENLTLEEAEASMNSIMSGEATHAQMSAYLVALRMKGETIDEIAGCAKAMRANASTITPNVKTLIDTCGTGGDGRNTFNISTTSAFVCAGAGLNVAKHGNKAVSSKCGSANVLSELGVKIDLEPEKVKKCIEKVGIGFLFAPMFHSAMKNVTPVRQELGARTIFNILGPLCNPANAKRQVIGVYDKSLLKVMASVLEKLGSEKAIIVHGSGLDEATIEGKTTIAELDNGRVKEYEIYTSDAGIKQGIIEDVKGGDVKENAEITISVLNGEKGPKRDIVVLNSALAIIAGGLTNNIKEAVKLAEESIDSGKALKKLEELVEFTNKS